MNVQKVNFKSKYIFPNIKSLRTLNDSGKSFVSTILVLTDKKNECSGGFSKNGLILKIMDKFDKNLERIANFYDIYFIKQ